MNKQNTRAISAVCHYCFVIAFRNLWQSSNTSVFFCRLNISSRYWTANCCSHFICKTWPPKCTCIKLEVRLRFKKRGKQDITSLHFIFSNIFSKLLYINIVNVTYSKWTVILFIIFVRHLKKKSIKLFLCILYCVLVLYSRLCWVSFSFLTMQSKSFCMVKKIYGLYSILKCSSLTEKGISFFFKENLT